MRTLYDITEHYQNILDLCFDDNLDPQLINQALKSIDAEIEDKVSNGIALIQSLQNHSAGMDAEIKRLTLNKRAIDNRINQIKQYYLDNLASIGKSKVLTARGTMTVAKAGGKRPLVIDDENALPIDFKKSIIQTLIDKDSIRDALERGLSVDGAHLAERSFYLKIS